MHYYIYQRDENSEDNTNEMLEKFKLHCVVV